MQKRERENQKRGEEEETGKEGRRDARRKRREEAERGGRRGGGKKKLKTTGRGPMAGSLSSASLGGAQGATLLIPDKKRRQIWKFTPTNEVHH